MPGAVVLALGVPMPAVAQVPEPRIQLSVGGLWASGSGFGSRDARLTQNQAGSNAYVLFKTETELQSALGVEARLTYDFTRTVGLEVGGSWGTSRLSTQVADDAEGAPGQTVSVGVSEYTIDAAVLVRLRPLSTKDGRFLPFLSAGVGYLRQLYEGNMLVETGTAYHAGGGVLYWFGPPRRQRLKRVGVRADARWTLHDGGLLLGDRASRSLTVLTGAAALQF